MKDQYSKGEKMKIMKLNYDTLLSEKEWKSIVKKSNQYHIGFLEKHYYIEDQVNDLFGTEKKDYFEYQSDYIVISILRSSENLLKLVNMFDGKNKEFVRYIDKNTSIGKLLPFLNNNNIDGANVEFNKLYKLNPNWGFKYALSLFQSDNYMRAYEVAERCLNQCEIDILHEARLKYIMALSKYKNDSSEIVSLTDSAFELYTNYFTGCSDYDPDDAFKLYSHIYKELVPKYGFVPDKLIYMVNQSLSTNAVLQYKRTFGIPNSFLVEPFSSDNIRLMFKKSLHIKNKTFYQHDRNTIKLRAVAYKYLSRYDDAIDEYKLLSSRYTEVEYLIELAGLYSKIGDRENALICVEQAINIEPRKEEILIDSIKLFYSLGEYEAAEKINRTLKPENKVDLDDLSSKIQKTEDHITLINDFSSIDIKTLSADEMGSWLLLLTYFNHPSKAYPLFLSLLNKAEINKPYYSHLNIPLTKFAEKYGLETHQFYMRKLNDILDYPNDIKLSLNSRESWLFINWLEEQNYITKITNIVKNLVLEFDDKLSLLLLLNMKEARELLEEYRDLLTTYQYEKHNTVISIYENKPITLSKLDERVLSDLIQHDYMHLLSTAFANEKYDLCIELLSIETPEKSKYEWIKYISYIEQNSYKTAKKVLTSFDLKAFLDSHIPSHLSTEQLSLDVMKTINSITERRIDVLLSPGIPYHKIPIEHFLILLKKMSDESIHAIIDAAYRNIINEMESYPERFELIECYGDEYKDLQIKRTLLKRLEQVLSTQEQKSAYTYQSLRNSIQESIMRRFHEIVENSKLEERNRILANLSHSIKNMLRSVIDPLVNLKNEMPEKSAVIDNAIKGANLIREIVNAINLSFKTSIDDLIWDAKNPGSDSLSLEEIIGASVKYSIGNMFDFRYFPTYAENYFPRNITNEEYENIKNDWLDASSKLDINSTINFANKHLVALDVYNNLVANYSLGNEKSSAIKLMVLFQELIFNAVKYTSFVEREKRFINIRLFEEDSMISFEVENSYRPEIRAKTTGVGKLVIDNFAKILDCDVVLNTDNNVYSVKLKFKNIWRING